LAYANRRSKVDHRIYPLKGLLYICTVSHIAADKADSSGRNVFTDIDRLVNRPPCMYLRIEIIEYDDLRTLSDKPINAVTSNKTCPTRHQYVH
jgi:hypothetical protein